jgi:hypothetical protein
MLNKTAKAYAPIAILTTLALGVTLAARLDEYRVLPSDDPAIGYRTTPADNPIEVLREKLAKDELKLQFDPEYGYLLSVLEALKIPTSSQVLVFTKTSFQAPLIAPRLPRAIYHEDGVSIGIVRLGEVLEVAVQDRRLGTLFYTLDQVQSSRPQFVRRGNECLQCHQGPATSGVPGLLVSSVFPERSGRPIFDAGFFVTDHRSEIKKRWGGWYVSGTTGSQVHMGNLVVQDRSDVGSVNLREGSNKTDLKEYLDIGAYVEPTSDVVSLMVLEHKTRMFNLITRVGFETRLAFDAVHADWKAPEAALDQLGEEGRQFVDAAIEELVGYMLFTDEVVLEDSIQGSPAYAGDFQRLGPHDKKGRSLRDLDMQTRMFKYPLSFLIYSESFDGIPAPAKQRIYERLREVLSGEDQSEKFARLTAEDRTNIREILLDTKPDFVAAWK